MQNIEFDARHMGSIFAEYLDYALALLNKGETTAAFFYFKRSRNILFGY